MAHMQNGGFAPKPGEFVKTSKGPRFILHHSTDGLIARLNAMADDDDDEWSADVLRQSANKLRDTREVLIRVSKEADFSQCPGLEDAVDFVLSGLPNGGAVSRKE